MYQLYHATNNPFVSISMNNFSCINHHVSFIMNPMHHVFYCIIFCGAILMNKF